VKKIIFLLLPLAGTPPVWAQAIEELLYSNEVIPARSIYMLENGYKIIVTVPNKAFEMETLLLSAENLVVDTLALPLRPAAFHYLGQSRVALQGEGQYYHYIVQANKVVPVLSTEKSAGLEADDFTVLFNGKLLTYFREGRKFGLIAREPDAAGVFSPRSPQSFIELPSPPVKLKKSLIYQLPITFAYHGDSLLLVYSRGQQALFIIDQAWHITTYRLPHRPEQVWAYYWDAAGLRHYAVKCTKKKKELFQLSENALRFIGELDDLPIAIYDYQLLNCLGSYIKSCDFYVTPIVKRASKGLNILEPVEIRRDNH